MKILGSESFTRWHVSLALEITLELLLELEIALALVLKIDIYLHIYLHCHIAIIFPYFLKVLFHKIVFIQSVQ